MIIAPSPPPDHHPKERRTAVYLQMTEVGWWRDQAGLQIQAFLRGSSPPKGGAGGAKMQQKMAWRPPPTKGLTLLRQARQVGHRSTGGGVFMWRGRGYDLW